MLDKYIEELVKTSSAREKLDEHLQGLAKTAAAKAELEHKLQHATVGELAKLAGVKLPENACTTCGNAMEKLGSIFQCSCGTMKKVAKAPAAKPLTKQAAAKKIIKTATEKCSMAKTASVKVASMAVFTKALNQAGGDADKALTMLEQAGYTKLAFNPMAAAKTLGSKVMGSGVVQGAKNLGAKAMASPMGQKATQLGGKVMQSAPVQAAGKALVDTGRTGQIARTVGMGGLGAATGAITAGEGNRGKGALLGALGGTALGAGAGTVGLMRNVGKGSMKAGLNTVGQAMASGGKPAALKAMSPGIGTAAKWGMGGAAAGGAATGALIPSQKTAAAEMLLKVGDAAGRIMAKTAAPEIDSEDIASAIEEAKEREDVPGQARRFGIGGGLLGGAGGGALGYGAARLLGAQNPWLRAGATGLGAIAGGLGGGMLGSREGAEEAQANRLVSFLRGRRAYMTGAQTGMQQGYLQGLTSGQGEEEGEGREGSGYGIGETGPQ